MMPLHTNIYLHTCSGQVQGWKVLSDSWCFLYLKRKTINVTVELPLLHHWKNVFTCIRTCLTRIFDEWLQACAAIHVLPSVGARTVNVCIYPYLYMYYNQLKTNVLHFVAYSLFSYFCLWSNLCEYMKCWFSNKPSCPLWVLHQVIILPAPFFCSLFFVILWSYPV